MQQLSLSARPKTLDGLLGQDKLVAAIRGHFKSERYPKAWLFSGPRGTGKTTTARILSLSYQCEHQTVFGRPCLECRRNKANFPIYEINAADATGIDKMRELLSGANSGVMGLGRYRVYILDEIQMASSSTMSLLLKFLEDTPPTTIFILCSTAPHKILETVRSRCLCYELYDLDLDAIGKLVERLLKKIESILPADRLSDALIDHQVRSPRLIAQAVEKYAAGCSPEDAALVSGAPTVDIMALSRAITRGHWDETAKYLQQAQATDARGLRVLLVSYLKTMLLESPEQGPRADAIAKALTLMAGVTNAEDAVVFASICASAYSLTKIFAQYTV
jgi:DNA polymerase III subunit gamma/tau